MTPNAPLELGMIWEGEQPAVRLRSMAVPQEGATTPPHHAVITGTGRAGTSFLVRFLEACGLEVGNDGAWFERPRAGLEHSLLARDLPYVVKDPWLFGYCDAVDLEKIAIDALIIPLRELLAAATSRVLQERVELAETEWRSRPLIDVKGGAPGGVIYSLDPVDQARILAVGFYRLVHWATRHEIPVFLLAFPRVVEDQAYLLETLWPWLGEHCSPERAQAAFSSTADPANVRIRTERDGILDPVGTLRLLQEGEAPVNARLDREAMAVLLGERERELESRNEELASRIQELRGREQDLRDQEQMVVARDRELAELRAALGGLERTGTDLHERLGLVEGLLADSRERLAQTQTQLQQARDEHVALRETVSWRLTRPLRSLRSRVGTPRRGDGQPSLDSIEG